MIRAGLVPFYIDENGVIHVLLMRPSDPYYGGEHWQIAKGIVETEDLQEEAFREGSEELGITGKDIIGEPFFVASSVITARDGVKHSLYIYAVRAKAMAVSGQYDYETGDTIWLREDQIPVVRKWQQPLLEKTIQKIRGLTTT